MVIDSGLRVEGIFFSFPFTDYYLTLTFVWALLPFGILIFYLNPLQ
jgi:hypothetical protein